MAKDPISKEMQNKIEKDGGSDYVRIKDDNNKIIIDENNPFVGRLLEHEYVEASQPRYGNDEGKKHVLTWLTRENGEMVRKKQSTTSSWFMQRVIDAHNAEDTWDIKWWYSQEGPKRTVPHAEAYEIEEVEAEEEEESGSPQDFKAGKDPQEEEGVELDNIPF